jgi:cyanate permease
MSPILVIVPPFFGDLFGRLHLASILGLYGLVIGLVGALGPSVAGRIAEAMNSYQRLYLLGVVANILFVILILFVKPTRVELEMNSGK